MRWLPAYIAYRVVRGSSRRSKPAPNPATGVFPVVFAGSVMFCFFGSLAALFIAAGPAFLAVVFVLLTFMTVCWTIAELP